jgi:hypothetical protein
MLAEARKYRLALTLANQHVGQLTGEIRDAVIGNVGSLLAFRLGLADAEVMERMLEPSPVTAQHLNGLPNFTAYGRLLQEGQRSPAFTLSTEPSTTPYDQGIAAEARALSRKTYGRRKLDVDQEINRRSDLDKENRRSRSMELPSYLTG